MHEELLETDNSVSVHFWNVQAPAIESYKVMNGFSPDKMEDKNTNHQNWFI